MRELTLLVLYLVGWSSAYLIRVPTSNAPTQSRIAPLGWVHIQKMLLPLFDNVCEESTNVVVVKIAQDFTLDTPSAYTKPGVIENFQKLKSGKGLLPKGEIFTEYNVDHMNELNALYEVLFYASDFDTFYRAAAWARQNVNCGLFVDAIYLAIVNRKDTARVSIPAPYELLPNYFIDKDVVVKASFLLNTDEVTPSPETDVRVEGYSYVLNANYTTETNFSEEDSKLSYFREDIGLNAYYFLRKLRNMPWFNLPSNVNNLYGERMFMMMKQFAARYDLERYSHGLPELEGFDWGSVAAYDPMLIYSNGNEFDHRSFSSVLGDSEDVTFLKTIENNLATVVNHLRQAGHNKAQILSHLMEILVTSDRSYETLCRRLLGNDKDSTERYHSVLEHYMTTLRDPMFWRINKKMVQLINNALEVLPSYFRNELYFPGVEVLNVETKKMMTSFDKFQFDVTDSLKTSTVNTTFQVKIEQPRLSHKPFVMKLNISSLVSKKGLVKIYIGPKMMPGELALRKHLFVLLDLFEITLKRGNNVISRSSDEMTSFSDDFMSLRILRKKVEDAEFGLDALPLKSVEWQLGYPSRLTLPRGLSEGLPLQVFVFVAPLTKGTLSGSYLADMEANSAVLSPGYPLDLPIEIKQLFSLPNSLVKEITVTHKSESSNGGKPGGGGRPGVGSKSYGGYKPNDFEHVSEGDNLNDFEDTNIGEDIYDESLLVHGLLGDRPDFTYRKPDNTNYAGNKHQYRQKGDDMTQTVYKIDDTPKNYNAVPKSDSEKTIPVDNINNKKTDILPSYRLLRARPDFTYKNTDTKLYFNKNNQYRKQQDYSKRKIENYPGNSQGYNTAPIVGDHTSTIPVVEDDITYTDTVLPHGLLGASKFDNNIETKDVYPIGKQYEYTKKEEERAAKREQKKEKYITKGVDKKEEYEAKRDQKKEENILKREKHLADLIKKGINEDDTNKTSGEALEYKDIQGENEDVAQNNIYFSDTFQSHGLLGKSVEDTLGYKSKTYQLKKKKEEYDPVKMQYKKVDYRGEYIIKGDKKSDDSTKSKVFETKDNKESTKYITIAENNKKSSEDKTILINKTDHNLNTPTDQTKENIEVIRSKKINDTILPENVTNDTYIKDRNTTKLDLVPLPTTNEGVSKIVINKENNISKDKIKENVSIRINDKEARKKHIVKVFDGNNVSKTTINEKSSKKTLVDKELEATESKSVDISSALNEKRVSSASEEETERFNYFTIYEPIITTEAYKKRVTVYDFLFNPVEYSDEKVYE